MPPDKWASGPEDLGGAGTEVLTVLSRIPTRRLVILGQPGSGKSTLLLRLALQLLDARASGESVPMLLSLAAWNPVDQRLLDWVEATLVDAHPFLGQKRGMDGRTIARALLDEQLLTLILDGFDEIAPQVRGRALAGLNDAFRPGQLLVLASRFDAYEAAVRPGGGPEIRLAATAGIALSPLTPVTVGDYLMASADGEAAERRWRPVLAAMTRSGPSSLGVALNTPLMTMLARVNYNVRRDDDETSAPDPAELLRPDLFPTPQAIEGHLFDGFIPAAYRRRGPFDASQAHRWLSNLARQMNRRQVVSYAWWELHESVPRTVVMMTIGFIVAIVGAVGYCLPLGRGLPADLGLGLTVSALIALAVDRQWPGRIRRTALGLTGGLLGGMTGATIAVVWFGRGPNNVNLGSFFAGGLAFAIAALIFGRLLPSFVGAASAELVAAVSRHTPFLGHVGLNQGAISLVSNGVGLGLTAAITAGYLGRQGPARQHRRSTAGMVGGVMAGTAIGAIVALTVGIGTGIVVATVVGLCGGLVGARIFEVTVSELDETLSPIAVLRRDRQVFWTSGLGAGLAVGLGSGWSLAVSPGVHGTAINGWLPGLLAGLTNLIALSVVGGFLQAAWGTYLIARAWLAVRRRLPWALMAFIADAADREVLRQTGSVYQFRHLTLLDRMAHEFPAPPSLIAPQRPHSEPRTPKAQVGQAPTWRK